MRNPTVSDVVANLSDKEAVKGQLPSEKALSRLDPTRRALAEQRLLEMPKSYQAMYLRALRGRSLRSAANATCAECVGWVRKEVRDCTALGCPLHPYRPYQKKET